MKPTREIVSASGDNGPWSGTIFEGRPDFVFDGEERLKRLDGFTCNDVGEVAFHGRADTTDAVFVAQVVQVVDLPADGDESSTE